MERIVVVPDDVQDAYECVLDLIRSLAWQFHRRHGGDFDEIMAEANYAFVQSQRRWKPERSGVTTWTQIYVSGYLKHWLAKRIKDASHFERLHAHDTDPADQDNLIANRFASKREFVLRNMMNLLATRSRHAVALVMEHAGNKVRCKKRPWLVRELKEQGYSRREILSTFDEVREALSA